MDEWGVDAAVTGSQKGFMLPPGLAIVALSPKAQAAVETAKLPRTFFDIRDMMKAYANNAYPYTPAVGLLNGLKQSCDMLLAEGLDNVFARHHRIAEGVRAAVRAWGLELCAKIAGRLFGHASARSAPPRVSTPPTSSPMQPGNTVSRSALASGMSRARCSASVTWAA